MIPEIGVMVGMYIVVRMLEMIFAASGPIGQRIALYIGGGFAVVIAVITMVDLMHRGSSTVPGL